MKGAKRAEAMRVLYWDEGLSLDEVGKRFGISRERVRQIFHQYGIPTRHSGVPRQVVSPCPSCGGPKTRSAEICKKCHSERQFKEAQERRIYLLRLREEEGLTNEEIAEREGISVASVASLLQAPRLEKYGISGERSPWMENRMGTQQRKSDSVSA